MRFSERMGFKPPKLMQVDSIDEETRNLLWHTSLTYLEGGKVGPRAKDCERIVWINLYFFKRSADSLPLRKVEFVSSARKWFMSAPFFEILDFIEYIAKGSLRHKVGFNIVLKSECVGFRFIRDQLTRISDEVESEMLDRALSVVDRFAGARSHITAALAAFSRRPTADYPNAVREAISAVESAAKTIVNSESATLGDAIKAIEKRSYMNPRFKDAVTKLYAYTSDEPGARHARLNETANFDEADAHFMIVTCAAIANFLVQRYGG